MRHLTPTSYKCPICEKELPYYPRYPKYICSEYASRASDQEGRRLCFYNVSMSGGYIAKYVNTKEVYDSHTCYVDGIECHADEARFGGIVIEVGVKNNSSKLLSDLC